MRKILLLCLVSILLISCGKKENKPSESVSLVSVDCYEYDTLHNKFNNKVLISINITNAFQATNQADLMQQNPIYCIGEFKSDSTLISVFEYTDPNFNIDNYTHVNSNWVVANSENYAQTFYKIIDKNIVGISISNIDKSDLDLETGINKLSIITGETDFTVPELTVEKSVTAEGTIQEPAKIGESVSTMLYNPESKQYESVIITINKLYRDYTGDNSRVTQYNNTGYTNDREFKKYNVKKDLETYIYEYSIYYPSTYTTKDGIIENPTIPITLCTMEGKDNVAINGILHLNDYVKDFNDVYKNTAKAGVNYTEGMGAFQMSKDFKNYLIKIDNGNGLAKYYTVK